MPRHPPRPGPFHHAEGADRPTGPEEPPGLFGAGEPDASRCGERLRRLALGLTAALITARAYWPGEDADVGTGLYWVLAILLALALAVASWWVGRTTRARWSGADAAVLALVVLVGLSTTVAADRRPAITLAWEWVGLGVAYLLLRWLPRTRGEAEALAGALLATACAVSAVGFYQIGVEDPRDRERYLRNPEQILRLARVPDDPATRQRFESRLLGSREPRATFALANSLAGFLVGPAVMGLAVALGNALRRDGRWPGMLPLTLAALPLGLLLACLLLTKSRSGYIGLLVGMLIVAGRERHGVSWRARIVAGVGLALVLGGIVAAASAAHQLDRKVWSESGRSLRFRVEYWRGTWSLITGSSRRFWRGVGPGNFAGPYLRHKLPTSSEEIKDPHNLVLEVWAGSGAFAVVALLVALGYVARETLGPPLPDRADCIPVEALPEYPGFEESLPPARSGWVWIGAGLGGWLLVVVLGQLNPFADEDLARWLVLGLGWAWSAGMLAPLWMRRPVPGGAAGAGVVAVAVNLLAAGGIGIPSVALSIWSLAALGLDLRDDRPCGRIRWRADRGLGTSLAMLVAALLGSFWGSNAPAWRCAGALAEAEAALRHRPPDFTRARDACLEAARTDVYAVRPWLALADLEYRDWLANGPRPSRVVGVKIAAALERALTPPRNPDSLLVQRRRMSYATALLQQQGAELAPADRDTLLRERANAAASAVALYPTEASLQAALAWASAAIGRFGDAARHAREALRLDAIIPHADRKLPDAVRDELQRAEKSWSAQAAPPSSNRTRSDG